MKSETREHKKSNLRWLKRAGAIFLVLLLTPIVLFIIGWFNRDLLIDELQNWYGNNHDGSLEIGEVDATFLKDFPNVGFTIKDIYQTNFDTILDKKSSIIIKKAAVSIPAKYIIRGEFKFRQIKIINAEIRSEIITEKSIEEYSKLKERMQSRPTKGLELPDWISKHTKFGLKKVTFISKDSLLNHYFHLELESAYGEIRTKNGDVTGNLDFKIKANNLGFNTKKGSYLNGTIISGKPNFNINQTQNKFSIPEFLLQVGSQQFATKANFDFNGITAYSFSLKNPKTNFKELKKMLPDSISAKLVAYEIFEPLETEMNINGTFKFRTTPFIDATFSTTNNSGRINKNIELKNLNFNGILTNTLNKDSLSTTKFPARRDIKVQFEKLTANWDEIKIAASDSYYQSSKESRNYINANLKMYGPNQTLAKVLDNKNFKFIGGNFNIEANIDGDVPSNSEIIGVTIGKFTLNNTKVLLEKNHLQLPVKLIDVRLNQEKSILKNLIINLPNGDELVFKGNINNISALLSDNPQNPATAKVSIKSSALNIDSLITTTMEFIPASEKKETNLKTLHETLEAIYNKFKPSFKIDINSITYNKFNFNNLVANLHLLDAETIKLDNLSFDYNNAVTDLQGTLKIPKAGKSLKEPIFIDFLTKSSGPLKIFQELFNIQLLQINNGTYNFSGNVTGNVQKFEQLLNKANGDLKMLNAQFYYPKGTINIELDSLKVGVHDANIILDKFVIEVGEHEPLALMGKIEDFPSFLLDSINPDGKIYVGLDANYLNVDRWMETMSSVDFKSKNKEIKKRDLAAIFADIYKFDPEISIKVDSLEFDGLLSNSIATKIYFENDSILKLDDLNIRFRNSKAVTRGKLMAKNTQDKASNQNPFNFEFATEAMGRSEDLNELLKTVNFTLRSGDFKFKGSYKGEARDLKILNSNIRGDLSLSNTRVDIKATNIQIPVDSLHLKIENNLATLDRLDVQLPGKSSIDITGEIDNFSNFINNEQAIDSHNSSFSIKSPYLNSKDVRSFIGRSGKIKDTAIKKKIKITGLKEILSNINNSYFPSANIEIDSLIYDKVAVTAFNSNLGFNNQGAIKIGNTKLNYYGGSINLDIQADVQNEEKLPVTIKMNIENIDLDKLVKDLDYFNNADLRNAEKISGILNLKLDLKGVFDNESSVNMESLNGTFQVELQDLAMYDFKPILESVVLLKQERFEKLQFQPIRQTFEVVNGTVIVPRTQIQSSAIQLFIEGEFKIGEYFNIWLSLPWNNILKSRDGLELPEKISYNDSGSKFYIQIVQDKESEKPQKQKLTTKFRLFNWKMNKEHQD